MSGYTPVFSSIYDGTLYGQWPAAAVFATLLPLCDVHGNIDMSLQAIAGRTGWPMDLLQQGIRHLCEPDPNSRSSDDEGRRLCLMEAGRPWGWRVVNHSKYREKARLQAKSAREVEAGRNLQRMGNRSPPLTAAYRRSPPLTAPHTHTQTHTQEEETLRATPGLNFEAWEAFTDYRRSIGKPLKPASLQEAAKKLAAFGKDQGAVVTQTIANGWQGLFALKDAKKPEQQARASNIPDVTGKDLLQRRAEKIGFRAQIPGEPDYRYEEALKEAERALQPRAEPKFAVVR